METLLLLVAEVDEALEELVRFPWLLPCKFVSFVLFSTYHEIDDARVCVYPSDLRT